MRIRHVLAMCVLAAGFVVPLAVAQQQQTPATQATTQAATQAARGGRGGGGGTPTVTPTQRDNWIGFATKNSYTPMSVKKADGTMAAKEPVRPGPITEDVRTEYRIDPYYKKYIKINGIMVIGSQRVSDWAFLEAAYTLDHQFYNSPQWVHDSLSTNKIRMSILANVEFTMDLPENNRNGRNSALADGAFQDRRSRGLGGMPWCSCAEENLLNLRGDPYGDNNPQAGGENITIHEFSHTTASAFGVTQGRTGDFWTKLRDAFATAMAPGGRLEVWNRERRTNVYASTNEQEYWAEGAQAWFNNARPGNSGGITTREETREKDPKLAALLQEIYGNGEWRYIKTSAKKPDGSPLRPKEELAHLEGFEAIRATFPAFSFNNSPRVQAAATQPGLQRGGAGGGGGAARGAGGGRRGTPATATAPGAATRGGGN